jgi:thiosulfate reductase cytochrome b subunit
MALVGRCFGCAEDAKGQGLADFIVTLASGSRCRAGASANKQRGSAMAGRISEKEGAFVHPLFVRVTHWVNAFAANAMLMSGLRIYDAAPLYNLRFPAEMTLGGWLAGALAWHFAAMWVLIVNGFAYVVYGVLSGHFIRRIFRVRPMAAYRNIRSEMKLLLIHGTGEYNGLQRFLYVVVIFDFVLLFLSGLALWKPVQFQGLTSFLGGYEQARHIHFFGMAVMAIFLVVHVGVAFAIRGTIGPMFSGRLTRSRSERPLNR